MDKTSAWINKWIERSAAARAKLEQLHGCSIDSLDFQEAVRERMGLERATDLLAHDVPAVSELVELLRDFDFVALSPMILQEIELDEPIIPSGVPRLLTEWTVRSGGEIWRIHQNDADPFPSSPHAHNQETGLKLHLGSGELFRKREMVSKIRCKDLKKLRSGVTKEIQLPKYTCD